MKSILHLLLITFLFVTIVTTAKATSPQQSQSAGVIDVSISLDKSPKTKEDRAAYEHILEYFADGVYEESNGIHSIGTVKIYSGGRHANKADILWRDTGRPYADISGRSIHGKHVYMYDNFGSENFTKDDIGWRGGGYTLAHEWGHFFYSLYDEYKGISEVGPTITYPISSDDSVPNSIMNSQWNARGGDFHWLNFSTPISNTGKNAQYRAYKASGWETLARPVKDDPKDGQRESVPTRLYYPALTAVAPPSSTFPRIDLPNTSARSNLKIKWINNDVIQIVIDHSDSMEGDGIAHAKHAASILVDLAKIGESTIGIIAFNDKVTVIQPLTRIDSQATKDAIKSQIDKIKTGGATAIGDAAQKAVNDINNFNTNNKDEDIDGIVYLLTDGSNNTGIEPLSVIPSYKSAKVTLFTFGFGIEFNLDADPTELQQMAQETGGKYYSSPIDLISLIQAFQDADEFISDRVSLQTSNIPITNSTPLSKTFHVDSTLSQLYVVTTYNGLLDQVATTLSDPANKIYTPQECSASFIDILCLFSIDAPIPGDWSINATDKTTYSVDFSYRVSALPKDNTLSYTASLSTLNGDVARYPEPIVLLATLNKELPIAGANVTGTVRLPNGKLEPLTMYDNGIAPDARANDGNYSAILDYDIDGTYNITVQFNNNAGKAEMKEDDLIPSIGPDGVDIPPNPPVPISENFIRLARLQIYVNTRSLDDHSNTFSNTTMLPDDNSDIPGKIDYSGDVDLFKIVASNNSNLIIRVTSLALGLKPIVRLFGADKTSILVNANLSTNKSSSGYLFINYHVNAGDTLYVEVKDNNGNSRGTYNISSGHTISSDISDSFLPLVGR